MGPKTPTTIAALRNLSEDDARALFEATMWPHGPTCPFCGNCSPKRIAKITPNPAKRVRPGLYMCKDCKPRRQFTVTTGTVFHGSKFPLAKWLYIIASMAAGKKGTSTQQIRRELNEPRRLANGKLSFGNVECLWHATMRVRKAMRTEPVKDALKGTIEADEAFIGGKPRKHRSEREKYYEKQPIVVLVERETGRAYSKVVCDVTKNTLFNHILSVAAPSATIMTDEWRGYMGIGEHFDGGHHSVRHNIGQYAKKEDGKVVTSNTAESYIAILKRSIYGTHHHYSRVHAQRYIDERDFVFSNRDMSDVDRVLQVLRQASGKRLPYRAPKAWQGKDGGLLDNSKGTEA